MDHYIFYGEKRVLRCFAVGAIAVVPVKKIGGGKIEETWIPKCNWVPGVRGIKM